MFKLKYLLIYFVVLILINVLSAQESCKTYKNESGTCIAISQCEDLSKLHNKDVLYKDELEELWRHVCGSSKENKVCCPIKITSSRSGSSLLPEPGLCGDVQSTDRVIFGTNAKIFEYPWMALIEYLKPSNKTGFYCGGMLINDRYVLTAAHCSIGKDIVEQGWRAISVRLGEWNITSTKDCELEPDDSEPYCSDDPIDIPIEMIINHETYNPNSKSQQHDIGLFRLSRTVNFTQWISPVCLPIEQSLRDIDFENLSMDIVGWGITESGLKSSIKRKARLHGINIKLCEEKYKENGSNVALSSSQVCALGEIRGNRQTDSCGGDSGGPLMILDKGPHFYALAIVSFGTKECGVIGVPGVYTKISSYTDWIISKLKP